MPRGGYRPAAGRPKGAKSPKLTTPIIDPMNINLGSVRGLLNWQRRKHAAGCHWNICWQ